MSEINPPKILLISNNNPRTSALGKTLSQAGYRAISLEDHEDLVTAAAKQDAYPIIICDGIGGYNLTKLCKLIRTLFDPAIFIVPTDPTMLSADDAEHFNVKRVVQAEFIPRHVNDPPMWDALEILAILRTKP